MSILCTTAFLDLNSVAILTRHLLYRRLCISDWAY